jgi:phenylacetate-CoA ligase
MAGSWQSGWRRAAIGALLRASASGVPAFLREFSDIEKMSPAQVAADQQVRLQRLLRHCHEHVPYYRRILDEANLNLRQPIDPDEFTKLPILTKDIIRRQGEAMLADDHRTRRPFENTSGGSTGAPLVFMQDRKYYEQNVIAAKLVYLQYYGKRMGDPEINLWGSVRDIQRGNLNFRARTINYLYNRTFQNAFLVDDERLSQFVGEINRRKPIVIWAYVESIDLLARFIRDNDLRCHSPEFIVSTAGTLYDDVRETVKSVFGCPVYNQYGSREVGAIAFETRDQQGMRGLPYLNLVELIDSRIIVTSLTNYSMPLLRYEIGDVAEAWTGPQNETLGCEKKIFTSVTGRVISHFKTADGGIIHGQYFIHLFYFLDWVRQFQVEQNALDEIVCRLVLNCEPDPGDLEQVKSGIREVMGSRCNIEFEYVDKIVPSESGKYMYTICNI